MARTVFTHRQSRNLGDLINGKVVRHIERLARQFNRARQQKMAIFAHDHIGIHINYFGVYDKPELELLFRFLAPLADTLRAGVALDVGANIGNHALFFSERFRAVHAFEPNPTTFHLLAFNAKLAGNVTRTHRAGQRKRGAAAERGPRQHGGLVHQVRPPRSNARSVEIEVNRLDDLGLPLEGLCFMKVDVEGFEPQVLRGAARTIATHQPLIVLEQHEREFVDGTTECIAMLRELGLSLLLAQELTRSEERPRPPVRQPAEPAVRPARPDRDAGRRPGPKRVSTTC